MALLILNTLAGEESPLTGFYDFKRTLKINGDYMITFSIDRNERNAAQFDQLVNKNKLVLDGDAFIIDDMERDPDGGTVTKEITARHEMFDRLYANWVSEEYTAQKSLQDWMAIVLANTGLDVEITGDFPPEQYENFGNDNSLNMFKDLIDRFQVEYRVYGTRIVIEKHIGIQRDAQFRHGHNLKTFSDEFNTDNLVTRVTAKGKNDDNGNPVVQVTVDSPNQDKFERIYAIAVQDERFTQEDSLTEFAESQFNEGDYSAKVEFIELVKNGLKLHEYDVGDNVWCIYDKQGMGLDLSVRIVGQDDNPFDKSVSPVVTLGTEQNNVITSFQTKTNEIQEIAKQANQNAILAIVQANGKNRNFYTDEEPTEGMIAGDIWFEKINGQYLRKYHYDGTQWILDVSADANDALNKAADALESANGKNTVYHQSAQPIAGNNGDVWFQQNADGTISLNIYQDGTWSDPTIDGVKAAQDDAATAVSTASAASNAAGSALSNAQTAINTANNAAGTASTAATNAQTAINTAQSAVSAANAANSAATAAQQSISTKVWMSDVNGAVANVQVGGTNLIPNSLDFNNTNFYKIGSHIETSLSSITLPDGTTGNALKLSVFSDSDNGLYRMTNVVPRNGAYTFSVWYRTANDDNSNVTCESDIADAPPGQGGTIVATNVWQRYSTTATIGNHDDGVHNFVDLYVVPGNSVYLYKPKLEVGNVATDWSPAPADMATATQFSQLNQTVNGISTQVSNKVDSSTYNSYTAQTDNTIATLLTKTDAAGTYATQSALSQTSSSLSSQISSVQSSANSYTDSRITQTSTSLQSTITAAVAAVQVG
ncbi:MAG: phage tail protein, partial [Sporolactobacillus sp.]